MMKNYQYLKDFILDSDEFKQQVKHKIVQYKADETILSADQVYPDFYFILSGSVRVVLLGGHEGFRKNAQPIITNLRVHHTFGELGLFDNSPAISDVVAIFDTEVIVIDKKSFIGFLNAHPEFGYHIMIELFEAMCHQIQRQNKNFYHLFVKAFRDEEEKK